MKRGIVHECKELKQCSGQIKILGISSGKRAEEECAREDPVSLAYLKIALKHAEKNGANTELIDLKELKINPCKECYSTCPAQCRYNEKTFQCDCYMFKSEHFFVGEDKIMPIEEAYDKLSKKEFFEIFHDEGRFAEKDDMWKVYKAMTEADGIIFASSTNYYGRPALLQAMFSRLCALDGGVEELWGDGKNLANSIKYAKNPKSKYKQRLYGKFAAFINCSKEGDSVTPGLMKACSSMGMRIIPIATASRVNWYDDATHRKDTAESMKDKYTLSLLAHIGETIVKEAKKSNRKYGVYSGTV